MLIRPTARFISAMMLVATLLLAVPVANAQVPVEAGVTYRLRSEVQQEDREYTVYLPASYKWRESRRYPTLYVLDGKSHFLHALGTTSYLSASGEIPEMIVVAVTSTVRVRDFTQSDWPEAWIGGGGAAQFKQFLATELIPHVDRHFRTDGFRVLVGHSASGQFALHTLATAPEMFRGYIALAPSLDWDNQLPARELQQYLINGHESPSFLYFAYADDEDEALARDLYLVDVLKQSAPTSVNWRFGSYPNESHSSVALQGQIDGLRELYSGYRYRSGRAAPGIAGAEEHFRLVSERLGWPVPVPEAVINGLGYAALQDERPVEAIALFERNTIAHPDSANTFSSLAEAYSKVGRIQEASNAAARAAMIAADPGHPNHAYYLRQAEELAEAVRISR